MINVDFFRKTISGLIPRIFNDEKLGLVAFVQSDGINKEFEKKRKKYTTFQETEKIFFSEYDLTKLESQKYFSFSSIFNNNKYFISQYMLDLILEKHMAFDELANSGFPIPPNIISKYWEFFSKKDLAQNPNIKWTYENLNRLVKEDKQFYYHLSGNVHFPFSYEILQRNSKLFNWAMISLNPGLSKLTYQELYQLKELRWLPNNYSLDLIKDLKLDDWDRRNVRSLNCVCCNTEFFWKTFSESIVREKCDFWLISRFGKIEDKLIQIFQDDLDEERIVGTKNTKHSDWADSHPVQRTGWENLFDNENIIINDFFVKNFFNRKIKMTIYEGDSRFGHYANSKETIVGDFFQSYHNFKISMEVLSNY